MQVRNLSFSAHADARGIMQMIRTTRAKNVVLVHGEAAKMAVLKVRIIDELGTPCFDPPNGQLISIGGGSSSSRDVPITIDPSLLLLEEPLKASEEGHCPLGSDSSPLIAPEARPLSALAASIVQGGGGHRCREGRALLAWTPQGASRGEPPTLSPMPKESFVKCRHTIRVPRAYGTKADSGALFKRLVEHLGE